MLSAASRNTSDAWRSALSLAPNVSCELKWATDGKGGGWETELPVSEPLGRLGTGEGMVGAAADETRASRSRARDISPIAVLSWTMSSAERLAAHALEVRDHFVAHFEKLSDGHGSLLVVILLGLCLRWVLVGVRVAVGAGIRVAGLGVAPAAVCVVFIEKVDSALLDDAREVVPKACDGLLASAGWRVSCLDAAGAMAGMYGL